MYGVCVGGGGGKMTCVKVVLSVLNYYCPRNQDVCWSQYCLNQLLVPQVQHMHYIHLHVN